MVKRKKECTHTYSSFYFICNAMILSFDLGIKRLIFNEMKNDFEYIK